MGRGETLSWNRLVFFRVLNWIEVLAGRIIKKKDSILKTIFLSLWDKNAHGSSRIGSTVMQTKSMFLNESYQNLKQFQVSDYLPLGTYEAYHTLWR
jgi:hypothetical protein